MATRTFNSQELSPHLRGSLFNPIRKQRATEKPGPNSNEMLRDSRQLLNSMMREFTHSVDGTYPSANFLSELPVTLSKGMSR